MHKMDIACIRTLLSAIKPACLVGTRIWHSPIDTQKICLLLSRCDLYLQTSNQQTKVIRFQIISAVLKIGMV